jgi:hypothetical protein
MVMMVMLTIIAKTGALIGTQQKETRSFAVALFFYSGGR